MKYAIAVHFIICLSATAMEKTENGAAAEQKVIALLETLEEHTSYPHPQCTTRITMAGKQLLACYAPLVQDYWAKSHAKSNALVILQNTAALIQKHYNSPLGESALVLHNHARAIYQEIKKIDEQVKKMPSCDNGSCMVASTKSESGNPALP